MALTLRSFDTLVSNAVTAAQGACASLLDFGVGSVGRALFEAQAGLGLWFQYLALQILSRTRLSTSTGADIDSWVAQFGMSRMVGTAATGSVTFTSFTPASQSATVAVGSLVKTVSNVTYAVTQDTSNPAWSVSAGAYVRQAGVSFITLPVQCTVSGSGGNVSAGAICLLGSSLPGIDIVTNDTALVNGSDGETDTALIARFPLWLAAKATASIAAVESAIAGVQTNLTYSIMDGEAPDQSVRAGYFTAVVDDGTGDPSDTLLSEVYSAVDAIRACGVGFAVIRAVEVVANISLTVSVAAGVDTATVSTTIQTALTSDIDARQVGSGYEYARIGVVAWNNAGVTVNGITNVLLNGGQADIPPTTGQVVRAGTITVTVVTT